MKKVAWLSIALFPVLALAGIDDVVPTEGWILELLQFITTAKGLGALAIGAGVTQLAMRLLQTPLANVAGKWRLTLVAALSVVGIVLGGMVTGLPFMGALLTAPALAAFQVLLNQIYKQFFEKIT